MKNFIKKHKFLTVFICLVLCFVLFFSTLGFYAGELRHIREGFNLEEYNRVFSYDELHLPLDPGEFQITFPHGNSRSTAPLTVEEITALEEILLKGSFSRKIFADNSKGQYDHFKKGNWISPIEEYEHIIEETETGFVNKSPNIYITEKAVVIPLPISDEAHFGGYDRVYDKELDEIIDVPIYEWFPLYYQCKDEAVIAEVNAWLLEVERIRTFEE